MEIKKEIEKLILKHLDNSKSFWTDLYPFIEQSEYSYHQFYEILTELIKSNIITIKDGNNISYLNLTKKGKLINNNELLFRIVPKGEKKKWYNQTWIGYAIAIVLFAYNVYQDYEKKELKNQVSYLEKTRDSLKSQVVFLNKNYDSLYKKYDSLKILYSPSNYEIEKQKVSQK